MSTLVIGIGNEWRQDDGVGLAIVRVLAGVPEIAVRESPEAGLDLLDTWKGFDDVILVDAMRSALPPGSVRCFSWRDVPPAAFGLTTHAIEVRGTLELAHALGRLPARVLICGVEGERFEPGQGLSVAVAKAIPVAVREVRTLAATQAHAVRVAHR